jgi:tetrahydromethanopterin S-methyltransferase subunit G
LDFTISTQSTFAHLSKKVVQIDKKFQYFPKIIAQHVEQDGNNWGREAYILYTNLIGNIFFTYGHITDQSHIPDFNSTVTVSTDKTVTCFSAALLLDHGLAIIDCVKQVQDVENPLQNYFYYINLTS